MVRRDVAQACSAMSTKSRWYLLALWLFLVIFTAGLNGREIMHGSMSDRIAVLVPLIVAAMIFVALSWFAPVLRARKMILRDVVWTFGEDRVEQITDVSQAQLKWTAFLKYRETSKLFLLYIQKSQAQFIPKRVLSEEQMTELRVLLSAHVKKA